MAISSATSLNRSSLALTRRALFDVAADGLLLVQRRLLLQDADRGAGGEEGVAIVRLSNRP